MTDPKSLREKLLDIQFELKAPKGQMNEFGNYKYRSCEDILGALKPLLNKHKVVLTIGDGIVKLGDRYYVKAQAEIRDIDSENSMFTCAYARETLEKKGMDGSQITGSASSYARKYALNGLFGIDDTKDADSTNKHEDEPAPSVSPAKVVQHNNPMTGGNLATLPQTKMIFAMGRGMGFESEEFKERVKKTLGLESFTELTKSQASEVIDKLQKGEAI